MDVGIFNSLYFFILGFGEKHANNHRVMFVVHILLVR